MTMTRVRAASRITDLANRVASHPRMQTAVMGAIRSSLVGTIEECLREMQYAGESVPFYAPKMSRQTKDERDSRIAAALSTGELQDAIARREGVTSRHVRRVKARKSGQIGP